MIKLQNIEKSYRHGLSQTFVLRRVNAEIKQGDLTLKATLYRPEGPGPFPAVVALHGCAGLYTDNNVAAMKRVVDFCRRHSKAAIGVQLAHAGRKASTLRPWDGTGPEPIEEGGWQIVWSDEPPVIIMPLSIMSAANSGGVS